MECNYDDLVSHYPCNGSLGQAPNTNQSDQYRGEDYPQEYHLHHQAKWMEEVLDVVHRVIAIPWKVQPITECGENPCE